MEGIKFTVLSNYLYHIRKASIDSYANRELDFRKLRQGILSQKVLTSVSRYSDVDMDNVRKTLHNCWLTEMNLHQSRKVCKGERKDYEQGISRVKQMFKKYSN